MTEHVPSQFLRSLETDLRSLCVDVKGRNRAVKGAAEHAILSIKEANTPSSEKAAADEAAKTFCAACKLPESSASKDVLAAQIPVSMKAVSCVHKLLTHQAISHDCGNAVLEALEEVASYSKEDALTLKILQAILSLLTVRTYVAFLSSDSLSRGLSLMLKLRSGQPRSRFVGSSTLSAITSIQSHPEDGVIEQTVQAAFRQVACDLFSTAAESVCSNQRSRESKDTDSVTENGTAERGSHKLEGPLQEAEGALHLFRDLCSIAAGDPVQFLHRKGGAPDMLSEGTIIDPALALEIIDDGLSANPHLFSQSPKFKHLLVSRLCPAIHELLRSDLALPSFRALVLLIVTLIKNFWSFLIPDCEILLSTLTKLAQVQYEELSEDIHAQYKHVFSLGCLYGILRITSITDTEKLPLLLEFIEAYDQQPSSTNVVSDIIICASEAASCPLGESRLLGECIVVSSRPYPQLFAELQKRCTVREIYVCIAIGLLISILRSLSWKSDKKRKTEVELVTSVIDIERAQGIVDTVFKIISSVSSIPDASGKQNSDGFSVLLDTMIDVIGLFDDCGYAKPRSSAVAHMSVGASRLLEECSSKDVEFPSTTDGKLKGGELRVVDYYKHLLIAVQRIGGSYEDSSWQPVIGAMHAVSKYVTREQSSPTEVAPSQTDPSVVVDKGKQLSSLQAVIQKMFEETSKLPWKSYTSLLKILIQSSRVELSQIPLLPAQDEGKLPKPQEEAPKGTYPSMTTTASTSEVEIFGLRWAKEIFIGALTNRRTMMPYATYQLFIGHLVTLGRTHPSRLVREHVADITRSVVFCSLDCSSNFLRKEGDRGRENLEARDESISIDVREWCLRPLRDLFDTDNKYDDTKLYTLNSLFSILQSRGAVLQGANQWSLVLSVLISATRSCVTTDVGADLRKLIHYRKLDATLDRECSIHESPDIEGTEEGRSFSQRSTSGRSPVSSSESLSVELLNAVFRCVQLIGSDFLESFESDAFPPWIQLLYLCTIQTEAVNVSLTSIVLLWRTADQLARSFPQCYPSLACALARISFNDQPSIRNSAIKTVTVALSSHASVLPTDIWNECVDDSLIPLLRAVVGSRTIRGRDRLSKGQAYITDEERVLNVNEEDRNTLLVHHTRNTQQKQWNETRVLALSGVSRVLRIGRSLTRGLSNVERIRVLVGKATEFAKEHEREVAVAGVAALVDILQGQPGAEGSESDLHTEASEDAMDSAVWTSLITLTKGQEIIKEAAFTLVDGLSKVKDNMRKMEILFNVGNSYRRTFGSDDTRLISLVLNEIDKLHFGKELNQWAAYVKNMVNFVDMQGLEKEGAHHALDIPGMMVLQRVYEKEVPGPVLVDVVDQVLTILASAIKESKGMVDNESVLRRTKILESFLVVMRRVLNVEDAPFTAAFWKGLEQCVSAVLDLRKRETGSPDYTIWEVQVVKIIRELLVAAGGVSEDSACDVQKRLLMILSSGAQEYAGDKMTSVENMTTVGENFSDSADEGRPRFVRACQKALFVLTDPGQAALKSYPASPKMLGIVELASRELVSVIQRVLRRFIPDCRRSGRCPLPIARRLEVVFLLRSLAQMVSFVERHAGSGGDGTTYTSDSRAAEKLSQESINTIVAIHRKVLQAVYPCLCECVESNDELVRQEARILLGKTVDVLGDTVTSSRSGLPLYIGNLTITR